MPKQIEVRQDQDDDTFGVSEISPLSELFNDLISAKGVVLIIAAALLYYLGWRFLFAYYVSFGIDPIFFSFTPIEIIFNGWRIYLAIILFFILAYILYFVVRNSTELIIKRKGINFALVIYLVILIIGVSSAIYTCYQFLYVLGAHQRFIFYLWAFGSLYLLWSGFVVGSVIKKYINGTSEPKIAFSPRKIYDFSYYLPNLWIILILVGFILSIAFYSSYQGLAYGNSDKGDFSRLQIANLTSNEYLPISEGIRLQNGTWIYENLRFLFKTDDLYFLFRLNEIEDNIPLLYAIPTDSITSMQLKPWFETLAHRQ